MINKSETLKKAQEILVSTLEHIDNICKKNSIEYWVDSGTLLGAQRNGKFIPWDDDIDLCMTRENYNKFINIASEDLDKEKYFLQNKYTEKDFSLLMVPSKIRVNNTEINEHINILKDNHHGIYIDIFPMDNYCESPLYKKIIQILYRISYLNFYKDISIFKKIIRCFTPSITRNIADYFHKKNYESANKKKSDYLEYSLDMVFPIYKFPKKIIYPLSEIIFEGRKYPCPNNVHEYLLKLYGEDYMTPPSSPKQHGKITQLFDQEY